MSRVIDLTQNRSVVLRVLGENDDLLFTAHLKRRLNRQQALETTKTVGKGSKAREVANLDALYRKTVDYLVIPVGLQYIIELPNGDKVTVGSETEECEIRKPEEFTAFLLSLPSEQANKVDEELFGMSFLGADRGNV